MDAFMTVALKVAVMIIMIVVGWVITNRGVLTAKGASEITSILLQIVTPCLIVNSFLGSDSSAVKTSTLLLAFATAVLAIFIAIVCSWCCFRKSPKSERTVLRFAIVFSNAGFMGIPLIQGILGDEGVIYGSFFVAAFNIISWTYGYSLMSGGEKASISKILFNPGTIGLAIGIPLYLLKVQLPDLIMEPVAGFANLNTPLAMIVVGSNIAKVKIKDFLTDKKVYAVSFIRLIVAPAILIGMLCLIRPNHDLFMSTSIQAAAPVAANCVLFSVMFNQDSGLASKLVAASTCLSIITIPLMTVLAQMVAGLVL